MWHDIKIQMALKFKMAEERQLSLRLLFGLDLIQLYNLLVRIINNKNWSKRVAFSKLQNQDDFGNHYFFFAFTQSIFKQF
jgi:hypothetical protein